MATQYTYIGGQRFPLPEEEPVKVKEAPKRSKKKESRLEETSIPEEINETPTPIDGTCPVADAD